MPRGKTQGDNKKQGQVVLELEDEMPDTLSKQTEAYEIESISGLDDLIKEENDSYLLLLMKTVQDKC
jgi:hypothetical protein